MVQQHTESTNGLFGLAYDKAGANQGHAEPGDDVFEPEVYEAEIAQSQEQAQDLEASDGVTQDVEVALDMADAPVPADGEAAGRDAPEATVSVAEQLRELFKDAPTEFEAYVEPFLRQPDLDPDDVETSVRVRMGLEEPPEDVKERNMVDPSQLTLGQAMAMSLYGDKGNKPKKAAPVCEGMVATRKFQEVVESQAQMLRNFADDMGVLEFDALKSKYETALKDGESLVKKAAEDFDKVKFRSGAHNGASTAQLASGQMLMEESKRYLDEKYSEYRAKHGANEPGGMQSLLKDGEGLSKSVKDAVSAVLGQLKAVIMMLFGKNLAEQGELKNQAAPKQKQSVGPSMG